MKFAMVTTFYPPYSFGGDAIYIQRMARALVRHGHQVTVIHDTDGYRAMTGTDPGVGDEVTEDGITVHRLRSDRPMWASLKVQQLGRPTSHHARIAELLGENFDVIHYHNASLVGGPGVWALGSGLKIHTAHEHWLVCPSHVLWRNNRELCDEKRCLRCVLAHRRPPQLWRATNHLARQAAHVDAFLTLSQSAADNHKRFGFPREMTVVPSFLPDEPAEYEEHGHTRPFFLFVGRLERIKGLDDVIPVFAEGIDADLLIAGTGGEEAHLRALAGDAPNIRFLGQRNLPQLRALYRDARAVITPSRCYEVFPLVVLEAFREATPIIARDLGPYPEIVDQSGGGMLFDSPDSLREALGRMIEAPKDAAAMGQRGKAAFDANWSEDVAIGAYLDLISSLIAKRAA